MPPSISCPDAGLNEYTCRLESLASTAYTSVPSGLKANPGVSAVIGMEFRVFDVLRTRMHPCHVNLLRRRVVQEEIFSHRVDLNIGRGCANSQHGSDATEHAMLRLGSGGNFPIRKTGLAILTIH